jgi:YD repeat-containing protein
MGLGFETLARGPDGEVYLVDLAHNRVVRARGKIATSTLVNVGTDDVAEFDAAGRHVATRSRLRGALKAQFGYTDGLLTSIVDGDGNTVGISRSTGAFTIASPHGIVTSAALDVNGRLQTVTDASGATTELTHTHGGRLLYLRDPKGGMHSFSYDATGRLTHDTDALPGSPGIA